MDVMSGGYPSLASTPRAGVGEYGLVAKLGQGGMADVFLAVARGPVKDFHKLVVLKRLRETLRSDAAFVEMFLKEARIAARLSHPNVVNTYSVDVEDGHPVIVMEYLDGVSLSALIKRTADRPFAERRVLLAAIAKSLEGLHYVHELTDYDGQPMQLVHRDIKPGNVLVTFDGHVKVVDFGIAKATAPSQNPTQSMALKGTARYMAPEAVGEGMSVDRRADVFAVGVMLWETAMGRRLWEGQDDLKIIRRLMDNEVPTLDAGNAEIPATLAEICKRALQADRDDRYSTVEELRLDLIRCLESDGLSTVDAATEMVALMEIEFGHRRQRRADAIKARLDANAQATAADQQEDDPPTLTPPGEISGSRTRSDGPSTVHRPARRAGVWIVATLAIVGGIVAFALAGNGEQQQPAAVAVPDPPTDPTPTPVQEPAAAEETKAIPEPASPTPPTVITEPPQPPPEQPPSEPAAGGDRPRRPRPSKPKPAAKDTPPPTAATKPHPKPEPAAPLQPGEMPSKTTPSKKPSLELDKDSPWGAS